LIPLVRASLGLAYCHRKCGVTADRSVLKLVELLAMPGLQPTRRGLA